MTLTFPALLGALLTTPMLPLLDVPIAMTLPDVVLVVLMGLLGTTAHFVFIRAFRSGPASALAPFTYSQLVWAALFGWLAFGQLPNAYVILGTAIIAGSGVLLAWHERRSALVREPVVVD